MSFLYFAPCQRNELPKFVATIAYAFDGQGTVVTQVIDGPSNRPGLVFGDAIGWRDRDSKVGYYPETQTWEAIPNSELWVGWYEMPTPSQLSRPKQLRGHCPELSDGNSWMVPILRQVTVNGYLECALPRQDKWDGTKWVPGTTPIAKYRHLWDAMEKLTSDLSDEDLWQASRNTSCMLLGANYRVSPVECSILSILTDSDRAAILGAAMDMPVLEQWLKKKKEPDG